MRLFAVLSCVLACAAASANESAIIGKSPNTLQAKVYRMGWADFCLALGKNLRKPTVGNMKLRELLRERAVRVEHISDADLYMLANGEIRIGADLCVVAAAFGRPDRVNRTVTSRGEHIQMVFKSPDRYVYFDKGIVTAFSD